MISLKVVFKTTSIISGSFRRVHLQENVHYSELFAFVSIAYLSGLSRRMSLPFNAITPSEVAFESPERNDVDKHQHRIITL